VRIIEFGTPWRGVDVGIGDLEAHLSPPKPEE
jgi:hypothetical protein